MNKRSKQVQRKKRLVMNYRQLNQFLKDDKFPLLKIYSFYSYIRNAHILLKFDVKSRFWSLGLDPKDMPKTAFCIRKAHYQWTILPFGQKVAPSLFQKAMTRVFELLLNSALIYIDDIYSSSHQIKTVTDNS